MLWSPTVEQMTCICKSLLCTTLYRVNHLQLSPTVTHDLKDTFANSQTLDTLCFPCSAQMHLMNTVPTGSVDQSHIVLFLYNRSMRSSGMATGKGEHRVTVWTPHPCSSVTHYPYVGDAFLLPKLPWELREKLYF